MSFKEIILSKHNENIFLENGLNINPFLANGYFIEPTNRYGFDNIYYYDSPIQISIREYSSQTTNLWSQPINYTINSLEELRSLKKENIKYRYNVTALEDINYDWWLSTTNSMHTIIGVDRDIYFTKTEQLNAELLFLLYFEHDINEYLHPSIIKKMSYKANDNYQTYWNPNHKEYINYTWEPTFSIDFGLNKYNVFASVAYVNHPGDYGIAVTSNLPADREGKQRQRPYNLSTFLHEIYHTIDYYISEVNGTLKYEHFDLNGRFGFHRLKQEPLYRESYENFFKANPIKPGSSIIHPMDRYRSYYGIPENERGPYILTRAPNEDRSWITSYSMTNYEEDLCEVFANMTINTHDDKGKLLQHWEPNKKLRIKAEAIDKTLSDAFPEIKEAEKTKTMPWAKWK